MPDAFLIYAIYSIFFVYCYWVWENPIKDPTLRTVLRTVAAALAPYLGWEFAVFWLFFRAQLPMGCYPNFFQTAIVSQPLGIILTLVVFMSLAFIQVQIVSWIPIWNRWRQWHKESKRREFIKWLGNLRQTPSRIDEWLSS